MYETLLRPHQVDVIPRPPSISVASENLKSLEIRKEEKRLRQIASAHRGKRKRDEDGAEAGASSVEPSAGEAAASAKRIKTDEIDNSDAPDAQLLVSEAPMTVVEPSVNVPPEATAEPEKISVSRAFPEVRGHTSYLTFAVLFPPSMMGSPDTAETSDSLATPPPQDSA